MKQKIQSRTYAAGKARLALFPILIEIFRELRQSHELGYRLFVRNLKATYRQSILGFTWALLPPLVTAALWIFLRENNVMVTQATDIQYPVFVLVGTILWQVFTESILGPLTSITSNKAMLVKINVPREGIFLGAIYQVLFNLLIKAGMLVVIYFFYKQQVGGYIVYAPLGLAAIVLFGFSIGLLLAPIGLLYTDIQRALALSLPFLMYLTPVVYPVPTNSFFASLMKYNPMATLIPEVRNLCVGLPLETPGRFMMYTGVAFFILIFGLVVYRVSLPVIIERSGS
ncbi:MAG: ABC transporter permease [Flavobacteriales bacterium]|nr:ABC transporter permease [Flavobacteriales bacterium]